MMEYLSEKKSLTHQVGPIGPGAEESKRPFFELPLRQRNRVIGYAYLFPDTPESGEDLQPSAELLNRVIACALSFEPVITPKELGKMLLEQEIFEYPERPAALPDNPQEIGMESISPDYLAAVIHLGKAKPEGQIALFQKLRASVPYCFNYLEQDWIWLLFCKVDVSRKKERFLSEMGVQKGEEILSCGISDTFSGMEQRGTYFQQAQKAAMAVAAKKGFRDDTQRTLRVATKFSNIASSYYLSQSRNIDIIHLNGSIELAPILGLSDVIVDIVETGTTLRENNLEVIEEIVPISARLIANKASYKFKNERIARIVREMSAQVEADR